MATARGKAELSDIAADHAREDYEIAKLTAKQFAPDFIQPGVSARDVFARYLIYRCDTVRLGTQKKCFYLLCL